MKRRFGKGGKQRPGIRIPGVVWKSGRIWTKGDYSFYGERVSSGLREWRPDRSKIAAAIMNGLKEFPFRKNSRVLYLGAASGTTVSHLSDIIKDGIIFAVEFSERAIRKLVEFAEKHENVVPILEDARIPENYKYIGELDVVFVDISQPDEIEISIRNANMFLKKGGYLMISVKSQSIDVVKRPEEVYREAEDKLRKAGYEVLQTVRLDPYEKDHAVVVGRKQGI